MPQFDVHRTTGQNRASVPYVVVLQSRRFDAARTRLGRLVGSLADDASSGAIINAIDAAITRPHG